MIKDVETLVADRGTNLFVDPAGGRGYPRSVRSQADNLGDSMSLVSGTEGGGELLVRTEFAEEADINFLMQRYDVARHINPADYGREVDYNLDLQTAISAMNAMHPLRDSIPEELQGKYQNWRQILNAVERGEYGRDLDELNKKKAIEKAEAEKAERAEADPKPEKKTGEKSSPKNPTE